MHAGVAAQVEAAQLGERHLLDRRRPEVQASLRQLGRRRRIEPRAVHRPRQRVIVEHHDLAILRLLRCRCCGFDVGQGAAQHGQQTGLCRWLQRSRPLVAACLNMQLPLALLTECPTAHRRNSTLFGAYGGRLCKCDIRTERT